MISHQVKDEKYQSLCQEWAQFLAPFDSSKINISIIYDNQNPLLLDAEGRKFQIDFESNRSHYYKHKAGIASEPLSRALGAGKLGKRVLDLSAGLGIDAIFLAQLGYQVTAVERNPFIFCALQNAWLNLSAPYRDHIHFVFDHAENFLAENVLFTDNNLFDVCYFDPMFPEKNKSALPRQEMVFFKNLVGSDEDAQRVLEISVASKKFKRCVVKRPVSAEALRSEKIKPAGEIKGKIIRYDIYSN